MRNLAGALLLACSLAFAAHANAQASDPKPATGAAKPAAKAKPKPAPVQNEENVKAVEKIFQCIAEGLPQDWRQARIVITEVSSEGKERSFEGRFEYSTQPNWAKPVPLKPCDPREVAHDVYGLNEFLAPERRSWKVATLTFTNEGKFELKYDYVR